MTKNNDLGTLAQFVTINAVSNSVSMSVNSIATNTFTVGTAAYFNSNGNFSIGSATAVNYGGWTSLSLNSNTNGTDIDHLYNNSRVSYWYSNSQGSYIGTAGVTSLNLTTNNTTQASVSSAGNVSIGTTVSQSKLNIKGRKRIIAPNASSYQENRWYSYEGHFDISGVDNNAYTSLLMFRPYQQGTTTDPSASSLWTRVGIEVRAGGHSSAIGSGDRWARYSVDYTGSSAASVITLQDTTNNACPRINIALSGWTATIQISGSGGSAGSLGGYCYIMIHFGGGEGSGGETTEWNVTEYY